MDIFRILDMSDILEYIRYIEYIGYIGVLDIFRIYLDIYLNDMIDIFWNRNIR